MGLNINGAIKESPRPGHSFWSHSPRGYQALGARRPQLEEGQQTQAPLSWSQEISLKWFDLYSVVILALEADGFLWKHSLVSPTLERNALTCERVRGLVKGSSTQWPQPSIFLCPQAVGGKGQEVMSGQWFQSV